MLKLEKAMLQAKHAGSWEERKRRNRNHQVAVLREQDWGMEVLPEGVQREERYLANESRRLRRDAIAGLAAAYRRKGKSLGEARRLAREDALNEGAPVSAYAATRPLTFNPFSGLEL